MCEKNNRDKNILIKVPFDHVLVSRKNTWKGGGHADDVFAACIKSDFRCINISWFIPRHQRGFYPTYETKLQLMHLQRHQNIKVSLGRAIKAKTINKHLHLIVIRMNTSLNLV